MSALTATSSGTILIVDDEPFILDVMSRLLGDAGYEIHTCYLWSGIANAVRIRQPNLVLLDYNMPGLRGDAICEILKRSAPASGMKIVLFSSEDEDELANIVQECGADGYILKGTPANELVRCISNTLAGAN